MRLSSWPMSMRVKTGTLFAVAFLLSFPMAGVMHIKTALGQAAPDVPPMPQNGGENKDSAEHAQGEEEVPQPSLHQAEKSDTNNAHEPQQPSMHSGSEGSQGGGHESAPHSSGSESSHSEEATKKSEEGGAPSSADPQIDSSHGTGKLVENDGQGVKQTMGTGLIWFGAVLVTLLVAIFIFT